jgi:transposase
MVFMLDECHLLWGDLCGYVWGKTDERIVVPIVNERQRQTYFGALNYRTKEFLVQPYARGNSENTIAFLHYLQQQCSNQRIAVIWDGASYHRSGEIKAYLESLNQGKDPQKWQLTCIRLAPNAPEQNPVEDIWLQAKRWIRECYHLCKSFGAAKLLFELVTHRQVFDFPKLHEYGVFS